MERDLRNRLMGSLESPGAIKTIALIYISATFALIAVTVVVYFAADVAFIDNDDTPLGRWLFHAPLVLSLAAIPGVALVFLLIRKCRRCQTDAGKRIAGALEKMGRGELGWKITLRRNEELVDVAESLTRASESLADRIGKLQIQARQLTEVESFLIDSIEADRLNNQYTLKALRKLKICTSRLNADMDDFHVSTVVPTGPARTLPQSQPQLQPPPRRESDPWEMSKT